MLIFFFVATYMHQRAKNGCQKEELWTPEEIPEFFNWQKRTDKKADDASEN